MKTGNKLAILTASFICIVVCLRAWASHTSVQLESIKSEPIWDSIEKCAENQKRLYQSIEFYVKQNNPIPNNLDEFQINGFPAAHVWNCPASQQGYKLILENYGNPKAVVIADKANDHPTTFMLWFRGLKPQVQTMGDGTIQLFKDGKLITIR